MTPTGLSYEETDIGLDQIGHLKQDQNTSALNPSRVAEYSELGGRFHRNPQASTTA